MPPKVPIFPLNKSQVLFPHTKPIFIILDSHFDNKVVIWSASSRFVVKTYVEYAKYWCIIYFNTACSVLFL